MNRQIMIGVGVGVLLLAIVVLMFVRSSPAAESANLSSEMPKPRPGSPTFATDGPMPSGRRGGSGRDASAAAIGTNSGGAAP